MSLWPETDHHTVSRVCEVLDSGRWAIAQNNKAPSQIDRVEKELRKAFVRQFAVTTCNGSAAILIALQALGIGFGDRVIVPATTWVGCGTAVLRAGAEPVFVDAGKDSPVWDPDQDHPKNIAAILAVHLYASQVNIQVIKRLYPRIPIIEDCSHCHGAMSRDGFPIGSEADISIYSFQATKLLTCGEGGAALTNNPEWAFDMEALRADGRIRDNNIPRTGLLETITQGANYAMSEISAALLSDQLTRLEGQNRRRAANVKRFIDNISTNKMVADDHVLISGAFHGLPVYVRNALHAEGVIAAELGIEVYSVYPAVPWSTLWNPRADLDLEERPLDNSLEWNRQQLIVIPHQVFLSVEVTDKLITILPEV